MPLRKNSPEIIASLFQVVFGIMGLAVSLLTSIFVLPFKLIDPSRVLRRFWGLLVSW
jgi:hypothetical protein